MANMRNAIIGRVVGFRACARFGRFRSPLARRRPIRRGPVRFIVPFPAGGVADVTARLIGQKLGEALGQTIVIENRPGASGTLGVDAATKATPDGYTLLFTTGDFITTPTLMPKVAFDPYKDLIPITMVATAPLLLGRACRRLDRLGQGSDRAGQGRSRQDRLSRRPATAPSISSRWNGSRSRPA